MITLPKLDPLAASINSVPGLARAEVLQLRKLGVTSIRNLLMYFPRTYIQYKKVKINELKIDTTVTVIGRLKKYQITTPGSSKFLTIENWTIKDKTGTIVCKQFRNHPYYRSSQWQREQTKLYQPGCIVAVKGTVRKDTFCNKVIVNPEIIIIDPTDRTNLEQIKVHSKKTISIYRLTKGVSNDTVHTAVCAALKSVRPIEDSLPENIRSEYNLIGWGSAIAEIHCPTSKANLKAARRRLVFDEFFYLQVGLLKQREQLRQAQNGIALSPSGMLISQFKQSLPFKLTNAQQRVVNEILNDLQKPTPMNRLVQGDVGSGKTVVAVIAILAAIQSGYQATLMAPTEVLAEQHYRKLATWLNALGLPVELLTGSTKTAKRRQIHAQLETGELPLLVGTHALIQDQVNFHKLGLVVIDEQHRFGVHQRSQLQQKGGQPHVLTMTATPIPRTLALTLHGDLDVSQIDELPPGRQKITTKTLTKSRPAYELIRCELAQGRQAYVVLPLIEESEKLDLKAAVDEYQHLKTSIFPEFQVGLLHGRMSPAEKDEIINAFRNNKIQIIVSTTVVEVGVDVPNATVMMIENAERFGLSQLHQLRGRVGRGEHRSYCLLMSNSTTANAKQRLSVLEQSQDGFFIAEMDMRLRGPGEVLGTRQSGLSDFALASLVKDQEVLEIARDAAAKLIDNNPNLKNYPKLTNELQKRTSQSSRNF